MKLVALRDGYEHFDLLREVKHRRQRSPYLQRFLDFIGTDIRIFAILQKARALVLVHELDERRYIRLPVRRKSFEIFEDGVDAGCREERDRIFGIFVEVGVEDSLVHEVQSVTNIEEHPP